jgi:hypothetical protein
MQTDSPQKYLNPALIIGGSLSFVTGLAWNDAFHSLFEKYLGQSSKIYAKFLYAAILTLVSIMLIFIFIQLDAKIRSQVVNLEYLQPHLRAIGAG